MTTTTYVNANLHHDQVTGRTVTSCSHPVNATPTYQHTKQQGTVETATFVSEFVTVRVATDQIIDLRYTLMYLGVPIRAKSYMFGDNKSVVDSASMHTSTLSKKSTLWLTVPACILPPYPRNQPWLLIIESGKPLPQDIINSTGRMANPILQTS